MPFKVIVSARGESRTLANRKKKSGAVAFTKAIRSMGITSKKVTIKKTR